MKERVTKRLAIMAVWVWVGMAALVLASRDPAPARGGGGFVVSGGPPPTATHSQEPPHNGVVRIDLPPGPRHQGVRPAKTFLPSAVTVPMEMTSGIPVVDVRVNGRGPFRFLLDTGASSLTVSQRLAAKLRLPAITHMTVTSVSPIASLDLGHPHTIQQLGIGSAVFGPIDGPAADLSALQMGPLDGILGMSVFCECRLTLDYPAGRVVLEPVDAPIPRPREGEVLTTQPLGAELLTVPVVIGTETLWCLLDSGSNGRLSVPASAIDKLPVAAMATVEMPAQMFGGDHTVTKLARLDTSLRLGRWEVDRPIVEVVEHDQLILGGGILEYFAVTIDPAERTVRLRRDSDQPIPSPPPLKHLGITLQRQNHRWVVQAAIPGVDLADLGLEVGDQITKIQRQRVSALSAGQLDTMIQENDALQLELMRHSRRISMRLPLTVVIP